MTQGTIFTCATAADYAGCLTYGLIITARCDIEHDKARIYNYLPIVALDDWLHRDGRLILAQRMLAEASGQMRGLLKEAGLSQTVLETENPRSLLNALFTGSLSKFQERFRKACAKFELAQECIVSSPEQRLSLDLSRDSPKLREKVMTELVHNNLNGYYFLQTIEPNGNKLGYVILLREIQVIPRNLATRIAEGLDHDLYGSICATDPTVRDKLLIPPDDFALSIGQLLAPHLEHLLQTLAYLFSRIGLPDPDTEYVEGLWYCQPTVIAAFSGR